MYERGHGRTVSVVRRFEGYGVLITGAARGIGAATAGRLAEEGARVLVTDVDPAEAEKTAASIRELGARAEELACDVGNRAAVEAAVAYAVGSFGSLDVLVNNAYGCSPDAPLFEDEPDEVWARRPRPHPDRRVPLQPRRPSAPGDLAGAPSSTSVR